MNKNNSLAIVLIVLLVLALAFAMGFFGMRGSGAYGGWGMMGPWMWGGMFFMWLIPLGLLVLAVLGVVWLVQRAAGGGNAPGMQRSLTCPSCGQGVQAGWKHCPNCGADLPG